MINNRQKSLLHIYAHAAGISKPTYRNILRESAGVPSAADPGMSNSGFDRAMAALEATLFARVARGEVPDPRGRSRWIHDEFHWRHRLPSRNGINTRRRYQIEQLWTQLCKFLPDSKCTASYLLGIVHKATGRDVLIHQLTNHESGFVLDALRDRLSYAIKQATETVPF